MNTPRHASRYLHHLWLILGLVWAASSALHAADDTLSADGIYERKLRVPGADNKEITFFLILPPGARSGADIKGVFSFCTWESDPKLIRAKMTGKLADSVSARVGDFSPFEHGMAMVSWTTFSSKTAFDKTRNFDEMTKSDAIQMEVEFDKIARIWRAGIDSLIKDYKLPPQGWFLYGMSRGGQWAHRLALRQTDLFDAVHIHINSSYDQPPPEGAKIHWLVTTGELEAGYPAAKRFYAAARKQNYSMIFYAEPKLGHQDSPRVRALGNAFFNYQFEKRGRAAVVDYSSCYAGDYLTHEYTPWAERIKIPAERQVMIPSKAIAEIWGMAAE